MLIEFTVNNFRSFADKQVFSFATTADSRHAATHCLSTGLKAVRRLSKVGVIFGPNGSGKTNFIKAFAVMRDIVTRSTTFSDAQFAELFTPFGSAGASRGTEFGIDLLLGNRRYRYEFAYNALGVIAERLLVYRTGKSQRWFERVWSEAGQRDSWAPFSQYLTGPRGMWRDATRRKSLFLTTACQLNSEELQPLYDWFENGVEIIFPSAPANLSSVATAIESVALKTRMLAFLHAADVRVDDIRVPEVEAAAPGAFWALPNSKLRAPSNSGVEFLHARGGTLLWLRASEESAGVQRLAGLFGPLVAAIEHGKLLLIDEFDLSLHPLVARHLIQLLNDPTFSDRGAQLLLTSHNTTLMDVNVMRRDEIWLMSLTDRNASVLSAICRMPVPPRKEEVIGKAYLRGRYGAVPEISPLPLATASVESKNDFNSMKALRKPQVGAG
jgi:hypothetical protein